MNTFNNKFINIPLMIRNNQCIDIKKIKNIEENILKLCESKNESQLIKDSGHLISVYDNLDLFHYVKPIEYVQQYLKKYNLENIYEGVVVRSNFLLNIFNNNVINEVNEMDDKIYLCYYKTLNNKYGDNVMIVSNDKIYTNPVHILLKQNNWYEKIGYCDGKILISNTFILEYIEKGKYMNNIDPIMNKKYDIFNIGKTLSLHELVNKYDFYNILNLKIENYEEINNCMTPIEKSLLLFSKERNIKLKSELKNIINILSNHNYYRPPFIYFNYLDIDDIEISSIIYGINTKLNIDLGVKEHYDKIDKLIITHLIKNDLDNDIINYIDIFKYIIDASDCENIVKYNSRNILKILIKNNNINIDDSLCCILLTEAIDSIQYLNVNNNYIIEKSKSILKEIIHRNKYISFLYLYKIDNKIINYKFYFENNILHSLSNSSKDILKLILNISPEIACCKNNNNQNIIMTNIDKDINILILMLPYIDLLDADSNKNNIIHYIVKNNRIDVIKYMLGNKKYCDYILKYIDDQNTNGETPLLISTINANESIFYILYNISIKTELKDNHGNTIYHYICKNKMCIGMEIKNIVNNYGFSPKDYCGISHTYWKWI